MALGLMTTDLSSRHLSLPGMGKLLRISHCLDLNLECTYLVLFFLGLRESLSPLKNSLITFHEFAVAKACVAVVLEEWLLL